MHYSLKRASTWNMVGYLFLILASLISTPILVKHLGLGVFSQYGLIIATLGVVSTINLGLPLAETRLLARESTSACKKFSVWATASILFVALGVVAGLVAVTIAYYLHVNYATLGVIFCLVLINSLVTHYMTLPHAEGHFGYYNIKNFVVGSANTLIPAHLVTHPQLISQNLLVHLGIIDILLRVQLLAYLVTLMCLGYFSLKYFPHPRDGVFSKPIALSLIKFGLKNQLGSVIGQIQAQYGKYLLIGLSPLTLSSYIIGTSLVQKMVGAVGQLATSFYPAASRGDDQPKLRYLYSKIQLYLFMLGLGAIVAYQYAGLPFLTWWLKDVGIATNVHSFLLVYRFYALLLLLTPMASTVVDGHGRPGMTSLFGAVAFALELIIAIAILPRYGMLAPAYAGLASLMIMTPLFLFFTGRILSHVGSETPREHV